jgi:hypothetical protein
MNNGQLALLALEHPELAFRQFPDAKIEFLRVQAGIRRVETLCLPPNEKTGFLGFSGKVERFHLKAFAATPDELHEMPFYFFYQIDLASMVARWCMVGLFRPCSL